MKPGSDFSYIVYGAKAAQQANMKNIEHITWKPRLYRLLALFKLNQND